MHDLLRGVGKGLSHGPTLRSIRRMGNLVAALGEINRRSVGIDRLPYEAYVDPVAYARWDPNVLLAYDCLPLVYLQEEFVFGGTYEPDPTEPLFVKGRVVERGTVANRILERAAYRKLSANLDPYFSDRSWGCRPGRSPEMAILEVRRAVRGGAHWALKTDIADFFPNVSRQVVELQLRDSLADDQLCQFILNATAPCILDLRTGTRWVRTKGLPQGNGLSPFLANLYLHRFDEAFSRFLYFRYVDDILALGLCREEVVEVRRLIERLLAQLGLRLNEQKTFVRDLHREHLVFLGYEIRGGDVYPPEKAIRRLERKLRVRGQQARPNLMKAFVSRYRIGKVRKLFRRIDRRLGQHYPPGVTLAALLDRMNSGQSKGSSTNNLEVVASPMGEAALMAAEKARPGQAPAVAAAGEQRFATSRCSLAPKETHMLRKLPRLRDPEYLHFIRSRPCSFCASTATEPHHSLKRLPGISEAGLAQKGSDYLSIPVCRVCHTKIGAGALQIERLRLLELIVTNLICFLDETKA